MRSSRACVRKGVRNRTRSTTMIEIVKPPSDFRAYRVVILPNGITAMLISDIPESDNCEEEKMEVDFGDGEAAAALCIGVGSFSDLPEIPGFAHFMEHMVFMGSKKYPKENYWDEYLADNGGESNAWTDCERTCFYFVCHQSAFMTALDIFAQFFISPLFNKQSVDREIMAVDSEWRMLSTNDRERMRNIIAYELVEEGHPMGKFMAGNAKSLKEDPEKNNINVYEQLRSFFQRMYSAHYMTLVLHSMDSLDCMEDNIIKIFSKVCNNDIPRPKFIKPPFQERKLHKLIKVIPMSDIHKMEIVWALPPLMEHYRARVLEFMALLLGHECKGSILSSLRRRNLAMDVTGGNDFTGFTHNSTWSAFILSVKLTELGAVHYEEVLKTVFQYIYMVKKNMPSHLFEEQKHIQETKYIFKEQEAIYSYVEEVAENMHMYPPEHYLCGRTLFFEYNELLIRDCLDFLRPQGMLVVLFNKQYINLPGLSSDPWLGVKYKVEDFDTGLVERLSNLEPNPELSVPPQNPYIATNFNLLKATKSTKFPVVVMDVDGCRIWYKKDNKYAMPNAFIHLNFISSAIKKSPQNVALSDIYLTMLLHKLTETLYNATVAGYELSVEGTPEGIVFVLGGYSEKIKLVVKDTVKVFLDLELSDNSFSAVVAHLKQVYINELIKPVDLARAIRYSLLEQKNTSVLERYEHICNLTYEMLVAFKEEFYANLFVEGFVSGNLRPEDAVEIGQLVQSLIVQPLPECKFPKPCMMILPVGDFKCYLSAINKEDTNCCVVHFFQQGLGTVYNTCLNEMLSVAMSEPLFSMLRTEQGLGYCVYCLPVATHGVLGFLLVVESQANKFSMTQIDELMEKFMNNFPKIIEDFSQAKFQDMVNNQAVIRSADDADLHDECLRYWQEIVNHNYVFDRIKLELNAVNKITKRSLVDWCKALVSDKKRKLTLMVEGHCTGKSEVANSQPDVAIKSIRNILKSLNLGHALPMFPRCHHLPASTEVQYKESLVQLKSLGTNFITDIEAFKSSLKAYPHHTVSK